MNFNETRKLGKTALEVTTLGFGGASLGDLYAQLLESEALDTVVTAYLEGIRLFDTCGDN